MIKIAQFGEGNFLRTFVDYYFENLNLENGKKDYDENKNSIIDALVHKFCFRIKESISINNLKLPTKWSIIVNSNRIIYRRL